MDHAGMEIDRVDLERFRKGLQPLVRKEYVATELITPKQISEHTLKVLTEQLNKKAK